MHGAMNIRFSCSFTSRRFAFYMYVIINYTSWKTVYDIAFRAWIIPRYTSVISINVLLHNFNKSLKYYEL